MCLSIILGASLLGACPTMEPLNILTPDTYVKEITCLATNIYHEARGESIQGQQAVAYVTINRVIDIGFRDTICKVVYQLGQFSWTEDGLSDITNEHLAYDTAYIIAKSVYNNWGQFPDPTQGATYYHADYITPYWASSFTRSVIIDSHIFYRK